MYATRTYETPNMQGLLHVLKMVNYSFYYHVIQYISEALQEVVNTLKLTQCVLENELWEKQFLYSV